MDLVSTLGMKKRHHEHRQNCSLKYIRFYSYKATGFCQAEQRKLQTIFSRSTCRCISQIPIVGHIEITDMKQQN